MTEEVKRLDDLATGIKQLLSEDRCSFSDEEKVLLNDCIRCFLQAKEEIERDKVPDLKSIANAVEILIKLMVIYEHLKHVF